MSTNLKSYLDAWAGSDARRRDVATTLVALMDACKELSARIADGPLAGDLGASRLDHGGGDVQKELDVLADKLIADALATTPVAAFGSEELDLPLAINAGAPLLVAVDPLDGSSNIDTNVSIGTIFSVMPVPEGIDPVSPQAFFQKGRNQLAAGYVIYGPNTSLVLTVGNGTALFTLHRGTGEYVLINPSLKVPKDAKEFAINMSNYRHWDDGIRLYVDDLLAGKGGPRGADFNMRWVASMVAEAHRILMRGGIYMYPGDQRKGYTQGRLRLIYEGNPIGFVMEQAGGAATNGCTPILDIEPTSLHQRVPLYFGSANKVERACRYVSAPEAIGERSPLFGKRGLFRA